VHDCVRRIVGCSCRRAGLAVTTRAAAATAAAPLAGTSRVSRGLVVVLGGVATGLIRLRALVRDGREGTVRALSGGLTPAATATPTAPAAGALSAVVAAACTVTPAAVLAVAVRRAAGGESRRRIRARRLVGLCSARDRDLGRLEDDQRWLEGHRGWRGRSDGLALRRLCLGLTLSLAGLAPGGHVPAWLLLLGRLTLGRLILGRLILGSLILGRLILGSLILGWLRFGRCGLCGPAAARATAAGRRLLTGIPDARTGLRSAGP